MEPRNTPGEFRTEPVRIGGGSTPVGAAFVGPRHELILGAIDDLIVFAQRCDVSVLAQIAVAHAQFETSSGPRTRVRRSPEVLAALDAFADRTGRRSRP